MTKSLSSIWMPYMVMLMVWHSLQRQVMKMAFAVQFCSLINAMKTLCGHQCHCSTQCTLLWTSLWVLLGCCESVVWSLCQKGGSFTQHETLTFSKVHWWCNLVHGNVQPPNILMGNKWFHIFEFDWTGTHDVNKCAIAMNPKEIWAKCVCFWVSMLKEHDNSAVGKLAKQKKNCAQKLNFLDHSFGDLVKWLGFGTELCCLEKCCLCILLSGVLLKSKLQHMFMSIWSMCHKNTCVHITICNFCFDMHCHKNVPIWNVLSAKWPVLCKHICAF